MNRCFRLLGLSQSATKEQVTAAYERKVRHYKGPDFMEEPEYAHRKLMELKGAYEEAFRLAGTSSASSRRASDSVSSRMVEREKNEKSAGQKSQKSTRLRDAERKEADHELGEKFHQWMEKRDEKKAKSKNKDERKKSVSSVKEKLKKPDFDFSKVKDKFNAFTAQLNAEDSASATVEDVAVESYDETIHMDSGQRIGTDGTISESKDEDKGTEAILKLVAALVMAAVAFVGSCEGEDTSYDDYEDYTEYETAYVCLVDCDNPADEDLEIAELADASEELLYEQNSFDYAMTEEEAESAYHFESELFAKHYWGRDSIPDVTMYLNQNYEDYPVDSTESMEVQLDAIFNFYGFLLMEEAVWYENPYTSGRMEGYADYLAYLNHFYETNQ